MDKKTAHIANKPQQKYTLMLVPNHSGKIYRFSVLAWIPKTIATLLMFTVCSLAFGTFYFSSELKDTQGDLYTEKALTNRLSQENEEHLDEIAFLKSEYQKIDKELASLKQLEHQVMDMVGLETDSDESGANRFAIENSSQSGLEDEHPIFAMVSRSASMRSAGPGLEEYHVDVEYLNNLISSQRNKMEQLVGDVEDQLEYLEAKPNKWPAQGRISSPFGERISPTNRRTTEFHQGIDIANASGTPVIASGSGIVTYSGYNGGYGRMIIISHGYGYTSVYAHNSQNLVDVGDQVAEGDTIARMGQTGRATGPHLHFEIRVHGEPKDPIDFLE
ncbi:MAG: M23 family metallopeptidase [Tindallia sp. MSAO_Bac2]|nr:MAG: M23 family metallopeptidase [Tindallia sp. MSAO_Bac2]